MPGKQTLCLSFNSSLQAREPRKSFIKVNGQIFQRKKPQYWNVASFSLSMQNFSSLLHSPQDSNLQAEPHARCQLSGWLWPSDAVAEWQRSRASLTSPVSGDGFTEVSGRPAHVTGTSHKGNRAASLCARDGCVLLPTTAQRTFSTLQTSGKQFLKVPHKTTTLPRPGASLAAAVDPFPYRLPPLTHQCRCR